MKIRHPALIRTLGWVGAHTIRFWMTTLRHRCRPLGPVVFPDCSEVPGPFIYSFWHERLLLITRYARCDGKVLVSKHADGQLIASVVRNLGADVVHGSSSRGGTQALWELIEGGSDYFLGVTPDGPRGPRRVVRPGLVYLAARTGLPIVPLGIAYSREWRCSSWDRFAIPKPFSTSYLVSGSLIHVPEDATHADLAQHLERVQAEMDTVTRVAENWARVGKFVPDVREESLRRAA